MMYLGPPVYNFFVIIFLGNDSRSSATLNNPSYDDPDTDNIEISTTLHTVHIHHTDIIQYSKYSGKLI